MKKGIVFLLVGVMFFGGHLLVANAEEEEASSVQFELPEVYKGDITDEMIENFLKADTRIRALRAQVGELTKKILDEEGVEAGVYLAVIQKVQSDPDFVNRLRDISQKLIESNN